MLKLNTIMLGTTNAKKLGEFYEKILQTKPSWEDENFIGFDAGGTWLMVGNHSDVKGPNKEPARSMLNFETSDVEGEFSRLEKLGAKVIAKPYNPMGDDSDAKIATFADPDGNYIQLVSPMK